jgi:hypothetical protein
VRDARIRDRRRKSWFSVDNEILEDFGEKIGLHGFAVYCALSRYANSETEEAQVSLSTLCRKLKVGRAKLLSTLEELRESGLIDIERGDRTTASTYVLLEVPKRGGGSEENHRGSEENYPGGSVQNSYKTTLKKTNSKEKDRFEGYEFLLER